ncbi:hypothetical protein MLD38_039990 [Melastoma candidum]|uniref:Uncharacterized protein n=1 Tax=Melastoma candidum TaxID=119954 RepID=A0ACB9L4S4_9MYRT|nr:hypothetical protein MLD38_039990 [Melastoma candidum]
MSPNAHRSLYTKYEIFIYSIGLEGSAADARVLQSALTREEPLKIPEGKFYLVDAGFGLTSKLLTPYGRTRYHLKEYSQRAPETREELFNHRHASLRNCIERAFGIKMNTPKRRRVRVDESEASSPRNFRWGPIFEETLLDLLLREARNGNRPDQTFTAAAYRNVVTDFNMIHGTNIQKKHIFTRMKTMKQHFVLFHNAFHSLSGFAWNHESQKFEAEDHVWDERIKANPKLAQLRNKSIQIGINCMNYGKTIEQLENMHVA